MTNPLRPFFSYYGSKWKFAPLYDSPNYDEVIEPFAGSAGYSCHHWERQVHLYDVDEFIVTTWKYLIAASGDDIMSLPVCPDIDDVRELTGIPDGARYLIGYRINPASAAPRNIPTKRAHWNSRDREMVANQVEKIKHWTVQSSHYNSIINRDATWYIDPPYQMAGIHYKHNSKSINFDHLGNWCASRGGQVMVCENAGATWLPFRHLADVSGMSGRKSTEVIWTNYDQIVEPNLFNYQVESQHFTTQGE